MSDEKSLPIMWREDGSVDGAWETDAAVIMQPCDGGFTFHLLPRAYIAAAENGDRPAIQEAASVSAEAIRESTPSRPITTQDRYAIDWAVDCLTKIANGTEPNKAFGWIGKRGRRGPNLRESLMHQMIATMIKHRYAMGKGSIEECVAHAAESTGYSEEMVWKYYTKHKDETIF